MEGVVQVGVLDDYTCPLHFERRKNGFLVFTPKGGEGRRTGGPFPTRHRRGTGRPGVLRGPNVG